jgi:hypothetical protein
MVIFGIVRDSEKQNSLQRKAHAARKETLMNPSDSPNQPERQTKPWPLVIRNGHALVRIYRCVSNRGYETYFVCWREAGIRKRIGISSPEIAKQKARQIAAELSDGSARLIKVPIKYLLELEALVNRLSGRIPND